jgi:GTP cyclohydrolase III
MNFLTRLKIFVFLLSFIMMAAVCEAQQPGPVVRVPQEKMMDRAPKKTNNRKVKKNTPAKSKKQAEAKKRKQGKEYAQAVKENRKHALEIQTPEVRERMKYNRKEANSKAALKRRKISGNSRKADRKYN